MGRFRRKSVRNPSDTSPSNVCQENGGQSNQQDKEAFKFSAGKCTSKGQPLLHSKDAVVLLEDIAVNSSLVGKRTVLGDKTNRSPMSSRQKQKNCNGPSSVKQQEKKSCSVAGRINEERTSYKLSNGRKLLSTNKSPLGVVPFDGNLNNQTKSSHFSDKCIYTKVQRETLRNKNMPVEEKLAQYEFEVDENEPVVDKKRKKKVTRKKKVKSKDEYCPAAKVFQKIFQAGVEEAEERIKAKPKDGFVVNVKSKNDFSNKDNLRGQTSSCEVQEDTSTPHEPPSTRKSSRSFSKTLPLGERQDRQNEKSVVRSGYLADLQVNVNENNTTHNTSFCEKSLSNLDVQGNALSLLEPPSHRRSPRSLSKNLSPVARPDSRNQKRSVRKIGNFADTNVNAIENNISHNTSFCEKSLSNLDVQGNALSSLEPPSRRRSSRSLSENLSPVARPDSRNQKRSVRKIKNFADTNVNAIENISHNTSFCDESHPTLDQEVSEDPCTFKEMPTAENRFSNTSGLFRSPHQIGLQLAPFDKTIATPIWNNVKNTRISLPEVTSTSTPVFQSTPLNRNCLATADVFRSVDKLPINHFVDLNKRVSIIPRESGGVNNQCNNLLAENWSVDNCFGFDDGSEEPAELSVSEISSKRRLRNNTPVISATSFSNERKLCRLKEKGKEIPSHVKRKRELTPLVIPNMSSKLGVRNEDIPLVKDKSNASRDTLTEDRSEKELETSVIENLSSPVTLGHSPYSNPLKQSKLDFFPAKSNTSVCETPKKDDQESPLLFKDLEDKTPIHFKEPPRRSYVRSVRKKMRPVGSEWIEFHSESEEEGEHSHQAAGIKRKRGKLNKREEKEANKWMKDFNRQCEEIEDFELCVEK